MVRKLWLVRLSGYQTYGEFEIVRADPSVQKLGEGPFCLMYRDKEIFRRELKGECRQQLDEIVQATRLLDAEIARLKRALCSKYGLATFPENL